MSRRRPSTAVLAQVACAAGLLLALSVGLLIALIYLDVNGETVAIDSRPSDAIALALRARAPIFVEETVIDNAKPFEGGEKPDTERLQKWLENLDPDDLGKYKM